MEQTRRLVKFSEVFFTLRNNVYFTISSPDIVEVSAVVTLEEKVFDEELENKTSPKYQELERNVKHEVQN